jgi:hypothetical protein
MGARDGFPSYRQKTLRLKGARSLLCYNYKPASHLLYLTAISHLIHLPDRHLLLLAFIVLHCTSR